MNLKYIFLLLATVTVLFSCSNDDNTFHLNTVKLIEYSQKEHLPEQKLYIKAFADDLSEELAKTEEFSSTLPMPITLKMYPMARMNLYGKNYHLELWGETSGYLGRCTINMDNYKIVFPIDMEVESEELSVSIQGTWD
ncbi:hypothetical protein NU10_08900 [Flavobacterium dauae]|uniref:hypothetical protein n=1 Tax=Flavobacterium dauae TaxID=1563479 RepID=UPI00101B3C3C|nr:hypothetical protein [Flavobacterium dauae]WLD22842.1 hypothetical protein NU10_08900 [Flavobacterium dauae]